jgi:hypothetical protein
MTMPDPHRFAEGEGGLDAELARRLRERRQLMLNGPLDGEQATRLAAELTTLEADGPEPVMLTVNSPGGDLPALFSTAGHSGGVQSGKRSARWAGTSKSRRHVAQVGISRRPPPP